MIETMTPSPGSHNGLLKRLVVGGLSLNLLVACMVFFSLQNRKNHYEERAVVNTQNISRVLDESISGILAKVDIALEAVSDEAERQLAGGAIQREALSSFIVRQHSRLPELLSFRATNALGDAVYGPTARVATTTSLAHRDYFKFLQDTPNAGMVVSRPLVGGISGKWMVILARRINDLDGSFAGLVYAGLAIDYLTRSFTELNVGANGSITLLGEELSLVARFPEPGSVGFEIGQKVDSAELLDWIKSENTSLTWTAKSPIDGVKRTFSYRRVAHSRPFYIVTGLSTDDYLTAWRWEVSKMSLLWAFFAMISVVSAGLFYRGWNKTRAAESALRVLNEELEERVRERTKSAENANTVLHTIIECMSGWVWDVDAEGRYTYCSPNVEMSLGYRPDEMIGKTPFDFMDHKEAWRLMERFKEFARQKMQIKNLENGCIAKDGRWVLFSTSAVPVLDEIGNLLGYRGVDTDLTERRLAEESLRKSEELFRSFYDLGLIGMAISSVDKRWIQYNDRLCEIFGYSREELSELSWSEVTHPDDLTVDIAQFDRMVAGEIEKHSVDKRYVRKDGGVIYAMVSVACVRRPGGAVDYFVAMVQDITDRRRAEEEKKKLESQLRHAQKLEAIGTLAGGIAHDFNNILFPIMGYTEMAMEDTAASSVARYGLEQVLSAATRAKELVRQILTFSRLGEDQLLRPIDIRLICKEVLNLLRATLPTTIEIKQNLHEGLALADATQIHQVIINLCTNAAHAIGDRGTVMVSLVKVHLKLDDLKPVSGLSLSPGPYLKLSVADTGQGMDFETVQHIFEPYFTTKAVGKGTGLGLAVVHGIVKRHGGEITVRSAPGKGSAFDVYLPEVVAKPDESAIATPAESLPTGSERILLVDDERMIVDMAAKLLEHLGYKVTAKTSSLEALHLFQSGPGEFDLMITDLTMPGLAGIDFAREVLKIRADMPIILCTGYSEKVTEAGAMALGIKRLIIKPLKRKTLAEVVRGVLDLVPP